MMQKYKYIKRNRDCDFFIFVCLLDNEVERAYIVPSKVVKDKQIINIGEADKGYTAPYLNKWDLIQNDK